MSEVLMLRRKTATLDGRLFIAGPKPSDGSKVIVKLADCTEQDAPMKVVHEEELAVTGNAWMKFTLNIPVANLDSSVVKLDHLSLRAEIYNADGKLEYTTKVDNRIDTKTNNASDTTIVVEQV